MLGRTGRCALLRKIGVSKGHLDFIEGLFIIRNAFAHRLSEVPRSLLHVVENHSDSQSLWRKLNMVHEDGGVEVFISGAKSNPEFLKWAIMDSVLQICRIANVIASKPASDEKKIS